jgi:hypothetical protein
MRLSLGLGALLLGLALAAPASAQDASNYWNSNVAPKAKPKPKPRPGVIDNVKKFTAKALDYNTYLPVPGSTDNSIRDPRLLPMKTPSETLVDIIDVARPQKEPIKLDSTWAKRGN